MASVKRKNHKGLKKRIRVSANGKIKFKHPNSGHLMSGKSGRRRTKLRKPAILKGEVKRAILIAVGGEA